MQGALAQFTGFGMGPQGAKFASPALPGLYEFLEAENYKYVIRLKANKILQECIAHLQTRPVGRPPNHVRRYYANFSYQAGSWNRKRRVVAKVIRHDRYVTFQLAEVAVPRSLFEKILVLIDDLRRRPVPA